MIEIHDRSPSTPGHSSEDEDSSPDFPTAAPLWARQTLKSAGTWVGDSSDVRRTRSEFQSGPHAFYASAFDPQTFQEASSTPEWDSAMHEEYDSLIRNHTWDLTPHPQGRKMIRCRWIYRTKFAANGSIDKYKARLVAKAFS